MQKLNSCAIKKKIAFYRQVIGVSFKHELFLLYTRRYRKLKRSIMHIYRSTKDEKQLVHCTKRGIYLFSLYNIYIVIVATLSILNIYT
jgi:hypothetical protein